MQSLNAAVGCRSIVVSSSTCADVILVISEVLAEDDSAVVTQDIRTSNGGCRREEKSRKLWSLFTKLLSLATANLFFD